MELIASGFVLICRYVIVIIDQVRRQACVQRCPALKPIHTFIEVVSFDYARMPGCHYVSSLIAFPLDRDVNT